MSPFRDAMLSHAQRMRSDEALQDLVRENKALVASLQREQERRRFAEQRANWRGWLQCWLTMDELVPFFVGLALIATCSVIVVGGGALLVSTIVHLWRLG